MAYSNGMQFSTYDSDNVLLCTKVPGGRILAIELI